VPRDILFFTTPASRCPIREFLDSLDGKAAQKVVWVLRMIGELDHIPELFFKKLPGTQEIWEVRVRHKKNLYRLFGFFGSNGALVLTHGIGKKSRKTPLREIQTAEESRRQYFHRRKTHE